MMKKNKSFVVALVALVVILGAAATLKFMSESQTPGEYAQGTNPGAEPAPAPAPAPAGTPAVLPKAPADNASDSDKAAFAAKLRELEKESTVVDIKSCMLNPLVVKVKAGAALAFHNPDSTPHTIMTGTASVVVLPNTQNALDTNFKTGAGIYGVRCDSTAAAGYLDIVK